MKKLFQLTCDACIDVYKDNIDLGTTEYKFTDIEYNGTKFHLLAFCGSNEKMDWFKNFNLWSTKGIKKVAVTAATEVHELIKDKIKYPVIVTGHSKAGPECIAYKKLFGAAYCIAFSPGRSLRPWTKRKMFNTWLFIDPDDPVCKAGFITLRHPDCTTYHSKNDPGFIITGDHYMDNWEVFISKM